MKKTFTYNLSKHKICLIDHLKGLEEINIQLFNETDQKKRNKLKASQRSHINEIEEMIPNLKSMGRLSDIEFKNLSNLDLHSSNFKLKFKIRG